MGQALSFRDGGDSYSAVPVYVQLVNRRNLVGAFCGAVWPNLILALEFCISVPLESRQWIFILVPLLRRIILSYFLFLLGASYYSIQTRRKLSLPRNDRHE
jgi:hypothetical protein